MLISGPNLEVKPQPTTQGPVVIQESRIQPTEDRQDCKEWLQRQDCVELSKIRPQAHVEWFVLHYRLQRLENLQWGLSASLPDEQNTFYARFEASNTFHAEKLPVNCNNCALTITVPDVIRSFKTVNTSKAPDLVSSNHVPGRLRKFNFSENPDHFLQIPHREHPDWVHECLVWQLPPA